MNKVFCRIFQGGMKVGMYFLPWHIPELIEGEGASEQIAGDIRKKCLDKVMIVTGHQYGQERSYDAYAEQDGGGRRVI